MIFKIFSPKNFAKKLAFFAQTTASFCKNCDHNIVFWEKRQFFAENWQKSQKIVIITSTPGCRNVQPKSVHMWVKKFSVLHKLFHVLMPHIVAEHKNQLPGVLACRRLPSAAGFEKWSRFLDERSRTQSQATLPNKVEFKGKQRRRNRLCTTILKSKMNRQLFIYFFSSQFYDSWIYNNNASVLVH
jgi:hypothetical protein